MTNYNPQFLSYQISEEISKANQDVIKPKMCYNNVFNIVSSDDDVAELIRTNKWKICYGAMEAVVNSNVYVRHCFFRTRQGGIIDPTVHLLNKHDFENTKYFVAKEFEYDDYITALFKSCGEVALYGELLEDFRQLQEYLYTEHSSVCIG